MIKSIRTVVIHAKYHPLPAEANPFSDHFLPEAPRSYVWSNFDKNVHYLHEAGRMKADLVCTNEDFIGVGAYVRDLEHPEIFNSLAEEIPGPISNELSTIARLYSMYIAANYYEKFEGSIYNTSLLIDRTGQIIGKYRKIHLADGERWLVVPGDEIPVFETEIGRVGFAICYDMVFPELSRILALRGADIIIHQTQGWGIGGKAECITGEAFMRTRAAENSVYLIVAKNIQSEDGSKSCILDNSGTIIAQSQGSVEGLVTAEFTPDFDMMDPYNLDNFYAGVPSSKARQLLARVPSLYHEIISSEPQILKRYPDMGLHTTPEQAHRIYEHWKELDPKEKEKYHW